MIRLYTLTFSLRVQARDKREALELASQDLNVYDHLEDYYWEPYDDRADNPMIEEYIIERRANDLQDS